MRGSLFCTDDGWETVGKKNKSSAKIDGQNHNSAFLGEYRPMAASQASRPAAAPAPAAQPAAPAQPAAASAAPASAPAPRSASHLVNPIVSMLATYPPYPSVLSRHVQASAHLYNAIEQSSMHVLAATLPLDPTCSSWTWAKTCFGQG